ncbi:MAG: hypothetical protein V1767_00135 [Chloroflexota bacterium]
MDVTCPGCGKRLKNFDDLEKHAARCKKLAKVLQLSYVVPVVDIKDLSQLEVKILPNNKDWGIWNANTNDWVKDKTGQIDSRVFQHNIKKLLNSIIASSIIANVREGK